ncbi:unnamed protein product [Ectocarpus fasciculatus]
MTLAAFTTTTPGRATKREPLNEPGWEIEQHMKREQRQRRTQAISQSRHDPLPDGEQLEQQRPEQKDHMNNETHDQVPEGQSLQQYLDERPQGQAETSRTGQVQQDEPAPGGNIMYHEEREQGDNEQTEQISGHHAVVDADQHVGIAAGAVWSKLQTAIASRNQCPNPPCGDVSSLRVGVLWILLFVC